MGNEPSVLADSRKRSLPRALRLFENLGCSLSPTWTWVRIGFRRCFVVTRRGIAGQPDVRFPALLSCLLITTPCWIRAQVVINEIFYHAPDDVEDLQYVELYNHGTNAVDLSGWAFTKGIQYQFPAGTHLQGRGFLVVCRNAERFKEFYQAPVSGVFTSKLKHKGERIELSNAQGQRVDSVKFGDRAPWPEGPDGHSGSLERISPTAPSEDPANWISSPLTETRVKPSGTPGKPNAGFSETLPPVIDVVTFSPDLPKPNEPIQVEARVPADAELKSVTLRFRLAGPGYEKPETLLPMKATRAGVYSATLPGQPAGQLIRFRVEGVGPSGASRFFPAATEPRPALSAYVPEAVAPAKIPFGWVIHTSEKERKDAEARASTPVFGQFRAPRMSPADEARNRAQRLVEEKLDLSRLWWQLTAGSQNPDPQIVSSLRPLFVTRLAERKRVMESALTREGITERIDKLPATFDTFSAAVVTEARAQLPAAHQAALDAALAKPFSQRPPRERILLSRMDLEGAWYAVSLNAELDPTQLAAVLKEFAALDLKRQEVIANVAKADEMDPVARDQLRRQIEEVRESIPTKLKPHLTQAQVEQLGAWGDRPREMVVGLWEMPAGFGGAARTTDRGPGGPGGPPPGFGFGPGGPGGPRGGFAGARGPGGFRGGPFGSSPTEPTSFTSAFVYFDPATGRHQLFDFVQITGRKGGQKVHFYRDHSLNEMTTIALIFEGDTASLVEPLAYEVYRRAGMPVEQSHYLRLWQDGKPIGYTLLIEQPNRAFLRRNQINDDGTIYKLLWFGGDLIGQHEKHTNKRAGHEDLVKVVEGLNNTTGDAQWQFIQANFEVNQVATYFAVNMVLSHWDGFFNNYFTYHDSEGTGKWWIFPWDQDSTWGLRGGAGRSVFYDMALTFGMNGDTPPANRGGSWRPPGWFSGPLLANPQFRQIFLTRTKQILETVYTQAAFGPVLDRYRDELTEEVRLRAEFQKADPAQAVERFQADLGRCREHLQLRREFLLSQPELRKLPSTREKN